MPRKTEMPEDVRRVTYDDLRKLADTSFKGDMKAAVYSLDPKVITATVDSFGGNIDRTNRPMYVHRDKSGKITGYSTTNSGDALDKGVKPEGRFQSVLVPFVRQGKDGPEYTEDYNVAQKWYDESGQHYGKFDMDFTTPEAKARSIDRFNAASWLVHREQVLRYQPEFDKLLKQQAAKAGDAGSSKSSGVPSGHNPALDGYSGPRIVINPSTFGNEKDALCVAFDEAFRILMEELGFRPDSEPTDAQRKFFSDTAYNDDELQLRRTILARICTFDTSVSDPTDEQLQEAVEFLDTVMETGAPQNEWERRAAQRIRDTVARSIGQPKAGETAEPPAEGPSNAAAGGGETDEDKPNGTFGTKEAVDYRDNNGSWRTSTGQLIGDDSQKKQYDQAKEALKGFGAYYDNGVFRTQDGAKIGGNLEAVQKWAVQAAEASKTEGSYFDGKWRDPTGKVMKFSGNNDLTSSAGGGSSGQSNMDGRTLGKDGFLRDSATGKLDMFGAQTMKGTAVYGQGYATQSGDAATQGKSQLSSGEQAWQERKRQSTEAWAERTGRTDSAGHENDAAPTPDAGAENGSEVSGTHQEAGRIGSGDIHQMNGPSRTGRRLGEIDIHQMH